MKRSAKQNIHPGELFKTAIIEANHLNVLETAAMLGVTRPTLSRVINGRAAITPNMALRIEQVFGGKAKAWLKLQLSYDLKKARTELETMGLRLKSFG